VKLDLNSMAEDRTKKTKKKKKTTKKFEKNLKKTPNLLTIFIR
jgi:hypothetical protein